MEPSKIFRLVVRRTLFMFALTFFFINITHAQTAADSSTIMQAVEKWEQGWNERDVALMTQDYAEVTDWTNAFGGRVQSRDSLATRLRWIFNRGFIKDAQSDYVYNDLTFLTPDIALLRSKAIVKGQLRPDGEQMGDRHIHHLRVFERRNDRWLIVSHLISQAQDRL